jgi:pilin isopeptide linkage protein
MANKEWLNADGTEFTGTPPALSFSLSGTTTVGSLPVTNIPMLPGVPVLVLDGNYTISEPTISGFKLVNIFSNTMQPDLPDREASVITSSALNNYSATFVNQAIPINAEFVIYGEKIGNGAPLTPGLFSYSATDAATGEVVATATNTADSYVSGTSTGYGSIVFTPIIYTEADIGDHMLIVRETGTTDPSWTIDTTTYFEIEVNVSLSGSNIVVQATDLDGYIMIHNYHNARGSFTPLATKQVGGASAVNSQFTFAVLDSAGNVVSTGVNVATADGTTSNIAFTPITYSGVSAPGVTDTYTYTIVETNLNVNGWRLMNAGTNTITVTVSDPGAPASLIVTPTYSPSPVNFINVYSSSEFLTLSAQKTASGGTPLRAGQFQFAVVDNSVTPAATIATGSNDANGNVVFTSIGYHSYTPGDVGFHRYSIIETSTSAGGWTTSSVVYPLLVSVVDNGNGTMTVTPFTILRSATLFTNVYGASGSVTLRATKTTNGGTLAANQFEFAVQNEFGVTVATGVNDAAGNITFTPINYTTADVGTHNYTVFESSAGGGGWTPSSVVYNVSVQVVDNGDGTITATPTYPASGVVFVNTYNSFGSIALSGRKTTVGSALTAGQFRFAVMDENSVVVSTGTNDANGDILFSAIPYRTDDVGVHNYTIVESSPGSVSWQTDNTVFNVSVNVIDNGDGTFSITPTYPAGDVVFSNTFIPPPAGSLTISKSFSGLPSSFDVFNQNNISPISFVVVGTNNANVEIYRQTVLFNRVNFQLNSMTGNFECRLTNLPLGTYSVTESGGHASGYQLSTPTPLPPASLTTSGATFNITNSYTQNPVAVTPAQHPALTVNKVFHGLTTTERPGNFQLVISGPGGFSQTLNLNQAVSGSGGTFTNLATGAYTIRESNSGVPGFNMTVSINNTTVTLPYTVQVTTGHITVTIDNFYTPVPTPSPPTGINSNIVIAIVLLSLGAVFIAGAMIYRKRSSKIKKNKDDK